MPVSSRWTIPTPSCSLQQWIFGSATGQLSDADKRALIDPDRPDTHFLTFGDFRLLSKQVALGLLDQGIKSGDRVLLFSSNQLFFPSVFLGILMAGGIFTGANPSFVARELAYQLRDSGAAALVVAEQALPIAVAAAEEVGLPRERIFVFDTEWPPAEGAQGRLHHPTRRPDGVRHWHDLVASHRRADGWAWAEPTDPATTTCCLNYSSGTTGVPKGVEISHTAYVANGEGVVHVQRQYGPVHFEAWRNRSRGLCFLPLYHAYGQAFFIANFPHLRIPVYVMHGAFDLEKMLSHVQRYRITLLTLVPPIVVALAKHPAATKYDLSSVETVGSGAAPLGADVGVEVERRLFSRPNASGQEVVVRQGWGMTEVTCSSLSWDPLVSRRGSSAVGELAPNCAAKIMDLSRGLDEATGCPTREITEQGAAAAGELWVTGPNLLRGYWHNPEATRRTVVADADGTRWLRTGDVAHVETWTPPHLSPAAPGEPPTPSPGPIVLFHIVDRLKELIKVKANQVAPAELEALLLEREDVVDAAVIGVTVDGGEVPRAYLVPKPGTRTSGEDVAKWLAQRVAPYKRLKGGVRWVDSIPKNPSGKILRKILRDEAKREAEENRLSKRTSKLA